MENVNICQTLWQIHVLQHIVIILLCIFLRYAKYYLEDKIAKRTLFKVFGIRIDIIVQSLVGNTSLVYMFLNISKEDLNQ